MKSLPFVFLLFAGAALSQTLFPQDITFSWLNADQYEDGSLIELGPTDVFSVRIDCVRNNNAVPILSQTFTATGPGLTQTEVVVGGIPQPGTYTCVGYSIVNGIESQPSASIEKKYTGRPKPPTSMGMN